MVILPPLSSRALPVARPRVVSSPPPSSPPAALRRPARYAHSLCPDEWMEKWDSEREEGNFPGIKYVKE
jgi:hypothetical protein